MLSPRDKRIISGPGDIEESYVLDLLENLLISPFSWFQLRVWIRSKRRPLSKEEALEALNDWVTEEFAEVSNWSKETGIASSFSLGSWFDAKGSNFVGAEVALGSNGATYYYFKIKKNDDGRFYVDA
jgi:hypothetical protein